jgi:hypothetical protein
VISPSCFTTKDGSWFSPTGHTRGPWDVDSCHAGPPVALMVRAVEALVPRQQLTRLTVELIRPIPMKGFRVQGEVRRPGRSATQTEAEIHDDDRIYARACGMHIRVLDGVEVETAAIDPLPSLSVSVPGTFPVSGGLHDEEWFSSSVECRYGEGS